MTQSLDDQDRALAEKIGRRAMVVAEAFLEGRAAISITRERTGERDPDSDEPVMKTLIRLVLD